MRRPGESGPSPSNARDALAYFLRRAQQAGGPVLEPMCGSGRFLLPLLRAGVDVDGVDAAPAMLEACRRRALAEGLRPALYLQVLEELALPRKYRMAFVPSGSLGLLAEPALSAALCRIRRHLEPGASLLIELVDPKAGEEITGHVDQRAVQLDDETSITYICRCRCAADGASIAYEKGVTRSAVARPCSPAKLNRCRSTCTRPGGLPRCSPQDHQRNRATGLSAGRSSRTRQIRSRECLLADRSPVCGGGLAWYRAICLDDQLVGFLMCRQVSFPGRRAA